MGALHAFFAQRLLDELLAQSIRQNRIGLIRAPLPTRTHFLRSRQNMPVEIERLLLKLRRQNDGAIGQQRRRHVGLDVIQARLHNHRFHRPHERRNGNVQALQTRRTHSVEEFLPVESGRERDKLRQSQPMIDSLRIPARHGIERKPSPALSQSSSPHRRACRPFPWNSPAAQTSLRDERHIVGEAPPIYRPCGNPPRVGQPDAALVEARNHFA